MRYKGTEPVLSPGSPYEPIEPYGVSLSSPGPVLADTGPYLQGALMRYKGTEPFWPYGLIRAQEGSKPAHMAK